MQIMKFMHTYMSMCTHILALTPQYIKTKT